jgi:hypothetical protein
MLRKYENNTIYFYKKPFKRGVDDVYTLAPLRSAIKTLIAKIFSPKDTHK